MSLGFTSEQPFFCVVAPIHWETDLREAYASFRGVKGSLCFVWSCLRGWLRKGLKKSALKQLWLLSRYLAFCGFISFHFGLLWLHFLSCLPQKCLVCVAKGPMDGAISCLRGGYAALTRGELVASDKRNSQLQGHEIPQESQSLMFKISYEKIAYASLLPQ